MGKNRKEYEVVLDSTPTFLEYVIGIGTELKYFLIMMVIMFVIVLGSLAIYILFGEGWDQTANVLSGTERTYL